MFKIRQVYKNKVQPNDNIITEVKNNGEEELETEFIVDEETGEIKEIVKEKQQNGQVRTVVKKQTKAPTTQVHMSMRRVNEESYM